jgi:hypothetical protein
MDEVLLMSCPKCEIMITVEPELCLEGRQFNCPICSESISFSMSKQELEERLEEDRRRRDRELKKQFRLAFGDV